MGGGAGSFYGFAESVVGVAGGGGGCRVGEEDDVAVGVVTELGIYYFRFQRG